MGTATFAPTTYFTVPGQVAPTLFGSAPTVLAALGDSDDTTGVHFGTTFTEQYHQFFLAWQGDPVALPATARIDWVRIDYRARHVDANSYIWVYDLRAFTRGTSIGHTKYLGAPRIASSVTPVDASTPTTRDADDGTAWRDCETFHTLVGRYTYIEDPGGWSPSFYPYLTKISLVIGYTLQPTVTNISPSGTTDDSTPAFTWAIGNLEETPPTAHQLVILPTGSMDAGGHAIGDAGFDPTTGSGVAFDSGKAFTGNTTHTVTRPLAPATWHAFIRQWIGTGIDEYASAWAHQSFVVEALTVDQPIVTLGDHAASNTVQVIITAGSRTQDLAAVTIEVEYLDPVAGWVAAPIANGMVNGTGTSVFYDGLHAPDESVSYRARGVAVDSGFTYVSPWTTATHTVANPHQWWLRSSSDYTLNRSLHDNAGLLMRTWTPTRQRPNATTWGIGARPATQVHDITKGDTHDCSIWAMTKTAYTDLRALLEDGDDLVLVNPWAEIWRVQPGGDVKEEVVRASPRSGEATPLGFVRIVTVSFVEVVTP